MYRLLEGAGYCHIPEKRFGKYIVDAYVEEFQLGFEADGAFWHTDEEREAVRDQYLARRGVIVIHLSEEDLIHGSYSPLSEP